MPEPNSQSSSEMLMNLISNPQDFKFMSYSPSELIDIINFAKSYGYEEKKKEKIKGWKDD